MQSLDGLLKSLDDTAQWTASQIDAFGSPNLTPALFLTTKKFTRASRVSELRGSGSKYATQAALLASVISSLSRQHKTLLKLSADCHNAASPITSLPAEVLQAIFLYVSDDLGASSQKAIPQLSLVCGYWRDTVLSCQPLWVRLGGWSNEIDRLGDHMKRAGPTVHLHVKERPVAWTTNRTLTNKVITLTVTSDHPNKLLDALTSPQLKNCTTLRLLSPSPAGIGMINIPTTGLPALSSLFLSAKSFNKFLFYDGEQTSEGPLDTIKHLEIHYAAIKLPNDMTAIAEKFPCLERLVLKHNATEDFPLLGPTPRMPSTLRLLKLDDVHADISNQFMSQFKPVTLTELNLKFPALDKENFGGDRMDFYEYMSFLPTHVPKIAQSIKAVIMGVRCLASSCSKYLPKQGTHGRPQYFRSMTWMISRLSRLQALTPSFAV